MVRLSLEADGGARRSPGRVRARDCRRRLLALAGAICSLAGSVGPLVAQGVPLREGPPPPTQDRLEGEVLDASTRLPVPHAIVVMPELRRTTLSDELGYFSFDSVAAGEYALDVYRMGYETIESRVQVGDGEILVVNLNPQAITIEGIDVTVMSGETRERRAAGRAMSIIGPLEMEELRLRTADLESMLRVKNMPGLWIRPARVPGEVPCLQATRSTPSIIGRSRGCRSVSIFMDGVYVGSDAAEWALRMSPEEIFAVRFLNPIEASMEYGMAGENGILWIETRRGR